MSELARILKRYQEVARSGGMAALTSVVNVSGSTYRRIGAHMLITEDGDVVGAVSGGCLDRDIHRQATWVMQSGAPKHLVYDSTGDDDGDDAFALGCNGVVELLVEPVRAADATMAFLAGCLDQGEPGVVATVFASDIGSGASTGSRLLWRAGAAPVLSGIDDLGLARSLAGHAQEVLASGKSMARTIDTSAGRVAVCFEIVQPPPRLVIFGGGRDAVALAAFATAAGLRAVVVDPRPGHATRARFPMAERLMVDEPQAAADALGLDQQSSAVVMHHSYRLDLLALRALLPKPISYLGVLGPRRRTRRLLADLAASGCIATEAQLARLYGPVGLDLGADTPEEVALAIVAEMKAVLAGRSGGPSRQRQGALHERAEPEAPPIGKYRLPAQLRA